MGSCYSTEKSKRKKILGKKTHSNISKNNSSTSICKNLDPVTYSPLPSIKSNHSEISEISDNSARWDTDAGSCFSNESVITHRLAKFDSAAGSSYSTDSKDLETIFISE